ncbi:MAG: class I SAM-dependent methyltransferase [bacterium]|nr:class I SAM-dependent methyltransferase [bacterium]
MSTGPSRKELVALQETLYSSRNPTRRWLHQSRKQWIEAAIKSAGPGARALEVGPGSGVYLPALAAEFDSVTATDIEPAHLIHLQPRFPEIRFVQEDITAPSTLAKPFDLVLCSEVVEHIADSASALRGIASLLHPGGTLILSTPQRYAPLELASKIAFLPGIAQIVRAIYREPILKQGHINLMTQGTVRRQLAEADFAVEREHFSGVYVPLLAEFGGQIGLGIARRLDRAMRPTPMSWALWTQYYVATRN